MKKYIVIALLLVATAAYAGINDRFSPIELTDYTGNLVSEYSVPLNSVVVDAVGPIRSNTTPYLTVADSVAAIVYANSGSTAKIMFTHAPSPAFAGMTIKVLASSSVSGTTQGLDWSIIANRPGKSFASAIAQSGKSFTEQRLDVNNGEIELKLNTAGINAVKAADGVISVNLWNEGTSNGTLEIKGIKVKELWKTN